MAFKSCLAEMETIWFILILNGVKIAELVSDSLGNLLIMTQKRSTGKFLVTSEP